MFEQFPYTDMHQLNLDWIVKIAKDFLDQYTHIQEVISDGETALTDATTDGLQQLDEKAQNLESLLQQWYDTHSVEIAQELARALAEALTTFTSEAQQRAAAAIESIPSDYTELYNMALYASNLVVNRLVPLNNTKVAGTSGINAFDKTGEHNNIVNDAYRQYNTGTQSPLQGFSVIEIDVTAGEKYIINRDNVHVCFFGDYYMNDYISGVLTGQNNYTFTVPANTKIMTVSTNTVAFDDLMIQHGVVKRPVYIPFEFHVSDNNINNKLLKGVTGRNLLDVSGKYTEIIDGYYIDYSLGTWGVNAGYCVAILKADPNTQYSFNLNNCHICFFSDVYGTEYINGVLTSASLRSFTTPANTKSISISFPIAGKPAAMFNQGSPVNYAPFVFGIDSNNIVNDHIHYVGTNKEFTTIQAAINAAQDGDTIYIDAGVYTEALNAVGKTLHLIGTGKNSTIVQYAGTEYYNPPLEIATGIVENISFICTAQENQSYCAHIDWDEEAGHALQFINCYFENHTHHCVGIGLREHYILNFTNCMFSSALPPIFCHEQQANNKTGQMIELIDCSIKCSSQEPCIALQESVAFTGNTMVIRMQRNIVKTNGNTVITAWTYPNHGTPSGNNYLNTAGWYLDSMSALNNAAILNG